MNLNHRITTVAVCSCKTNNYMLMRKKVCAKSNDLLNCADFEGNCP